MKTGNSAFSEITEKGAVLLQQGLQAVHAAGFPVMVFGGTWVRRRFVISSAKVAGKMPVIVANPLSETLAVSSALDAQGLYNALRRFGAFIERLRREGKRGQFDQVASEDDGARHCVHKFHHMALCGHKPKRWLTDAEVASLASAVQSCSKCALTAMTDTWAGYVQRGGLE